MQRHEAFSEALKRTLNDEGGVSLDKDDTGGQTVLGIARNKHPDLELWTWVDAMMANAQEHILQQQVDEVLRFVRGGEKPSAYNGLWPQVQEFYEARFWRSVNGEGIAAQSIEVALEVFDTSVNVGPEMAVRFLQEGCNLLNANERDYEDVIVDGHAGPKTLSALSRCLRVNGEELTLEILNDLQSEHYINLMRANPAREKWKGWHKRAMRRSGKKAAS